MEQMSLTEAVEAIRRTLQDDSTLGTRGGCRSTPVELARVVKKVDSQLQTTFLAAKPGDPSPKNHYALGISDADGQAVVVVNMDQAPGYPEYIGPLDTAPGLLPQMQPVEEII